MESICGRRGVVRPVFKRGHFHYPVLVQFCRAEPKSARRLVRKVCSSDMARELAVAEQVPGRLHSSHLQVAHGVTQPAMFYAEASGICRCCLMKSANRRLLINHLQRGSKVCLLNILLRVEPLTDEQEL